MDARGGSGQQDRCGRMRDSAHGPARDKDDERHQAEQPDRSEKQPG
jgi:hypothetical protein